MRKLVKKITKYYALVFVTFVMIFIASCNSSSLPNVKSNDGETPLKTIENYGEYIDYIQKENLKKSIVTYDTLAPLGTFKSFVVLSGGYNGDFTQYRYEFKDVSNCIIGLTITDINSRNYENHYSELDSASCKNNDMRILDDDKTGYVVVDTVEYMYVHGKLLWIKWEKDNNEFTLTSEPMLSEYPDAVDSFLSTFFQCRDVLNSINSLYSSN